MSTLLQLADAHEYRKTPFYDRTMSASLVPRYLARDYRNAIPGLSHHLRTMTLRAIQELSAEKAVALGVEFLAIKPTDPSCEELLVWLHALPKEIRQSLAGFAERLRGLAHYQPTQKLLAKWLKILDQVMEGCDGECLDRDHCDHER